MISSGSLLRLLKGSTTTAGSLAVSLSLSVMDEGVSVCGCEKYQSATLAISTPAIVTIMPVDLWLLIGSCVLLRESGMSASFRSVGSSAKVSGLGASTLAMSW